jgi:hypothetical protein|tara:strand:+ start:1014 stop:1400 length:387 start_codon:yes stop_codon:yes gene_type:complete
MNADQLMSLCIEAAETERRLPSIQKASVTYWPDTDAEWLAYADETTITKLARASTKQITSYHMVINIIMSVPAARDRRLIWGVAHSAAFRSRGPSWSQIARLLKCDRRTIKSRFFKLMIITAMQYTKE